MVMFRFCVTPMPEPGFPVREWLSKQMVWLVRLYHGGSAERLRKSGIITTHASMKVVMHPPCIISKPLHISATSVRQTSRLFVKTRTFIHCKLCLKMSLHPLRPVFLRSQASLSQGKALQDAVCEGPSSTTVQTARLFKSGLLFCGCVSSYLVDHGDKKRIAQVRGCAVFMASQTRVTAKIGHRGEMGARAVAKPSSAKSAAWFGSRGIASQDQCAIFPEYPEKERRTAGAYKTLMSAFRGFPPPAPPPPSALLALPTKLDTNCACIPSSRLLAWLRGN